MGNIVYHEKYQKEKIGKKVQQNASERSRPNKPSKVKSIDYDLDKSIIRNAFVKDRDRILYSKPFRRLEHKAQIFSHAKGDHFRTRLTHTIEVNQIAKSICRNLSLNEDLVESISLGHDIGHTPFGHQGERTLNLIMTGEDNFSNKIKFPLFHGGFKHNYQGLRTLDIIESIYDEKQGLYLTWQTIEGILKHTKIMDKNNKLLCSIEAFTSRHDFYFTDNTINLLQYPYPVTLEGQVVSLADEIAQRQHDLDDALADNELGIFIDDVIRQIMKTIKDTQLSDDVQKIDNEIVGMSNTFNKKLELILKRPNNNAKRRSLVSAIIEYFVIDATYQSMENIIIMHETKDKFKFKSSPNCFREKVISLSILGNKITDAIEEYINNRIVNSYDVNRFDGRAVYIVRQLFKAYFTNPKQMPDNVLENLHILLSSLECNIPLCIDNKECTNIFETNLRTGNPKHISFLLKLLKLDISKDFPFCNNEHKQYICDSLKDICKRQETDDFLEFNPQVQKEVIYQFEYDLWKVNPFATFAIPNKQQNIQKTNQDVFCKTLVLANHYFMKAICDYIAGMTDNFAEEEYQKLYAISHK